MFGEKYIKPNSVLRKKVPFLWVAVFLLIISTFISLKAFEISEDTPFGASIRRTTFKRQKVKKEDIKLTRNFHPKPISMDLIKKKGCVADGLLSGYGGNTPSMIRLINRSECVYLHRALETWGEVPDFERAEEIINQIKKPRVVYGMFIAENIRKNADYFYPDENRYFDFSKMCKSGTDDRWGEHTCIPDLKKEEYQKYVRYITHRAIDIGIQSFLFGQIYLTDIPNHDKSDVPKIIADMKDYAREKNLQIIVGAQTNSITSERYLRLFDYIEGGVGLDAEGKVDDGPCWNAKESCWGLLWDERYSTRANNVFLHLDWSGLVYDDMSTFAKMDRSTRIQTLSNLHKFFTEKNMGFMMPFLATINKTIGGCFGPMKRFYSPDNKYTCKDENQINAILKGN